jgi:RNA polymerase sigma-70 factor (ECF subfamily)
MRKEKRFADMYNQYVDDIYRFLLVHVRDQQLAEDLTAETFTSAWKNMSNFDNKHPRGWLYAIARNRLTDYWRKKKPLPLDETTEIVDERKTQDQVFDEKIAARELGLALKKLPEEMKSVITLRFLQGYSARQTAEVLGMSEVNIRVIQYRALKKLKKVLS